jgi:hypothetical protein
MIIKKKRQKSDLKITLFAYIDKTDILTKQQTRGKLIYSLKL